MRYAPASQVEIEQITAVMEHAARCAKQSGHAVAVLTNLRTVSLSSVSEIGLILEIVQCPWEHRNM